MNEHEIRLALDLHWAASDASDYAVELAIYRDDAILEYPQSGERIRGRHDIQASRLVQLGSEQIHVRRIFGGGGIWVTEFIRTRHGRESYSVSIMELVDGRVVREVQYFGDPLDPGPSRAHLVEQMR